MGDTPQSNYQNGQNFIPNIQDMYKSFVTGGATPGTNEPRENVGIDDLRAPISINVTGQSTANLIKSLNINPNNNTIAATANTSTPARLAQESRCHAFYRIIGFPVVSSDKVTFYNPGLDVIKNKKEGLVRQITLSDKITIASNVGKAFEDISQARETYANSTAQVFSVPESVEAGVLALMSGTRGQNGSVNIRKFSVPFPDNDTGPFDFDASKQVNPINIFLNSSLVGDKEVKLADYQDANGIKPNAGITNPSVFRGHFHIIKPFMVDPRIDFSIWASDSKTSSRVSRRVAVPFVPDASYLKASETCSAERPLLEKIITDRFSQSNNTQEAGQSVQDLITYIQSIKSIQTVKFGTATISQIFSNKVFQLDEQASFARYLFIIEAMMASLVDAIKVISAVQGKYYWLPIPSTRGPEGGCTVRPVPLNENVSSDLITTKDFNIIYSKSQTVMSSLNSSVSQPNTSPDLGGFAFNSFFNYKLTFDSSTTNAQGDVSAKNQDNLLTTRNRALKRAGECLQTVEMIMGEYSGLGLCDIIAVMGALYVMPKEHLLGFLDPDAYVRAQNFIGGLPSQSSSLTASDGKAVNIVNSMTSLSDTVKGFYLIMDQVYQDLSTNSAPRH